MKSGTPLHIGIDLGGTKMEGVVLMPGFQQSENLDDFVIIRERIPTFAENGYEFILNRTANYIFELVKDAGAELNRTTIGIGLPGAVSRTTGLVKNSNTTCLIGKDFRGDLQNILQYPAGFENDANCFALAESTWGAGKGSDLVFGAIIGTGVGGGLIYRGEILQGRQNIAGEWGHSLLIPDGHECYCGKKGCVETYLSGPAMENYLLKPEGINSPAKEFNHLYDETNDLTNRIIDSYCNYFGIAMGNLINILDPDIIVIGGGVSNFRFLYDKGIDAVKKNVFNDELLSEIKQAELGDSAGVFGAALVGLQQDQKKGR
ncbi:MAG: ROK family protein [Calditrichaceae bacterium]